VFAKAVNQFNGTLDEVRYDFCSLEVIAEVPQIENRLCDAVAICGKVTYQSGTDIQSFYDFHNRRQQLHQTERPIEERLLRDGG